jgi:YD repeat-containing protein
MKLNRRRGDANRRRNGARGAATCKRLVVVSLGTLALCSASGLTVAGATASLRSAPLGTGQAKHTQSGGGLAAAPSGASTRSLATAEGSSLGSRGSGPSIPEGAVAVPSLFTATSRTYKSPRGVFTTTLYGETVNVREAGGAWKPMGASSSAPTARSGASTAAVTPNASVSTNASHDCALASNSPTTSICNATTDTVGYDGTNTDNSLVEFELKEALPTGANVLNAQLGMYLSASSTKTAVSVSAYAATKAWTLSATWNTFDGTHAWTAPGGDFVTTNTVANPAVTTPAGWAHWYPTQIVQEWVNGTLPNDGVLLADTTQKTTKDMLSFNSLDASSNHPYLTISWTPRGQEDPSAYTMQPFPIDTSSTMKVNLASGDLFVNSNDMSVSGSTGPPLLVEHSYDSLNREGGSVNPWYSLSGASVYADGSVAIGINRYDFEPFIRQPDGSFLTPRGIDATLCKVNGTTCTGNKVDGSEAAYALTFNHNGNGPLYKAGYKMTFGSTGGVLSDADASGNAIVYHFGSKGIESISNPEGRTFTRSFHELKGGFQATSAWKDATGKREVKYAYNGSDQLETYTDTEGHKTKYAYDEEGELKEITAPNGTVTKLNYTPNHLIEKITGAEVNGSKGSWQYTYYEVGKAPSPCTAAQKATVATETEGNEEPPITYCANVFDEVELVAGYPQTGQPGQYFFEEELVGENSNETAAVNLASGNLLVTANEIVPVAANQYMTLRRFYNSQAAQTRSSLGSGWRWGTGPSVYLVDYGSMIAVHGASGYTVLLNGTASGTYTAPPLFGGTMTKSADGTYKLTTQESRTETTEESRTDQFNSNGVLTSQTSEAGDVFTVGDTTLSGKSVLKSLSPVSGKALEATYDATPHVTETMDPASQSRHYEYDASGRLKAYTDPSAIKTEYTYNASGYLEKITKPGGVETIAYAGTKVSEVTTTPTGGEAVVTKFSYQAPTNPPCNPATDATETTVTYATNEQEALCFNANGEFTGPYGSGSETGGEPEEPEPEGATESNEALDPPNLEAIICTKNTQYAHESEHAKPAQRANVVATLTCRYFPSKLPATVDNIDFRIALYYNHKKVADTGRVFWGNKSYVKDNAAWAHCRSGEYQGWSSAEWDLPPNYLPPLVRRLEGWGPPTKIKC